ncbi:hypothetical protein [Flavobacterium cheniae]|uniref:Uncharacterized protein n=1 Tax=Flavobacterium cheniae TaxID=295428 RepID=A0A562K8K9_9FLAO|nr:hypothetical protein [Flavobacterium cheniae]TDR17400.1 hypothetical protein C8D80_2581 [Flavobacterium cheniae]TWH91760.1 hypothetical protein IP97_02567 [Flavobacterium cheniae]
MEKNYCKKRIKYLFCLFFGFISFSYSQKIQVINEVVEPINLTSEGKYLNKIEMLEKDFADLKGTYQIQILKPEYNVLLSESLLEKIKTLRKEDEDIIIVLDDYSKLYLPSLNKIKSSNFIKLLQFQSTIK